MKRTLPLVPAISLFAWLSLVGVLIWRKAHLTLFPPTPDPLSYIQKAVHFWDNARKGFPANPLNLTQAFRPPGTVLISYPFGYDGDRAAFLFRTVYIPFLIWTAAVLILFWPTAKSSDRRAGITRAVIAAILFGASPFFFQLEFGDSDTAWGYMDQALGAVAGFAMAAIVRSLRTRSVLLLSIGVSMSCFALLLKPTGGLAIFYCGLFFVLSELLRVWEGRMEGSRLELGFLAKGTTMFLFMGGFVAWACLNSRYLDAAAFNKHGDAQSITRMIGSDLELLKGSLRLYSYAGVQGIAVLAALPLFLAGSFKANGRKQSILKFCFLVFLFFSGFYLWVFEFGFTSVRYFSLFAYMFMSLLLVWVADRSEHVPFQKYSSILATVTALLSINLLAMLVIRQPNRKWEKAFGTNLGVASDIGSSGKVSEYILQRYSDSRKEPVVYKVSLKVSAIFFHSMNSDWIRMENPKYRGYRVLGDINWYGNPAVDLFELIYVSDFLLTPKPSGKKGSTTWTKSREMGEERDRILDFITANIGSDWLRREAAFGEFDLLRIVDKDRFASAFDSAFAKAEWSPLFVQANGIANGRMHIMDAGSESTPLPESSEVQWKKMKGGIYQVDHRELREDTLVTTRGLALEGWLLAVTEKRPVMADSVFLTIDRPGHPTRFYPTRKKDKPEFGRYTAQLDLKGMDTCRLGIAMAKDGRIHRYPRFRKTVIVDPDAVDRRGVPLP